MTMHRTRNSAFTLVEILIVVVILGILAAIVIPQFTNASEEATDASARSQLQTIRSQIELYRVKNQGTLPLLVTNQWDDLVDNDYLQAAPTNPKTGFDVVVDGTAEADGDNATDGWVFDETNGTGDLYCIDLGE